VIREEIPGTSMVMSIAKVLFILGAVLIIFGFAALFAQRVPWVYSWFGHLPGDFRYEGERTFVYVPLASMIVLSIVLTIAIQLMQRFLR
jgi:hypothetical protein